MRSVSNSATIRTIAQNRPFAILLFPIPRLLYIAIAASAMIIAESGFMENRTILHQNSILGENSIVAISARYHTNTLQRFTRQNQTK